MRMKSANNTTNHFVRHPLLEQTLCAIMGGCLTRRNRIQSEQYNGRLWFGRLELSRATVVMHTAARSVTYLQRYSTQRMFRTGAPLFEQPTTIICHLLLFGIHTIQTRIVMKQHSVCIPSKKRTITFARCFVNNYIGDQSGAEILKKDDGTHYTDEADCVAANGKWKTSREVFESKTCYANNNKNAKPIRKADGTRYTDTECVAAKGKWKSLADNIDENRENCEEWIKRNPYRCNLKRLQGDAL